MAPPQLNIRGGYKMELTTKFNFKMYLNHMDGGYKTPLRLSGTKYNMRH